MSRDALGNFSLPAGNPVVAGTVIDVDWANPTMTDVAVGLTDSLDRKGRGGMAAPLVMNGYRVTSIGPATQFADAPQAVQIRDSVFNRLNPCTSDTSGNVYNGVSPLTTQVGDGTVFLFVADKANTGPMSLSVNGGAALPILMNGAAIPPGIILAGAVIGVMFLNLNWRLTNTAGIVGTVNSVQSDNVDAISVTNDFAHAVAVLNIHPNVPRGLVQLDSNGKVPVGQMPFTSSQFIGQWNAASGALPPDAVNGAVYLITGTGTLQLYRPNGTTNNYTLQATVVAINDQIIFKTPASTGQPEGWYYSPAPSGTATASNVSMVQSSANPPFAGITNVQSWMNAADPAILGRLLLTGNQTMTGPIFSSAIPATPPELANKQYVDQKFSSIPANVSSFLGDPTPGPRTGAVVLSFADVVAALAFTPVNPATPAFTGIASAPAYTTTGTYTGKGYTQTALVAPAAASQALDYGNGQSQILTLSAPTTFTAISNIPAGSILRLTLFATNNVVTWPASIHWPLGATPDLTLGPLKKAIVVIENDGGVLLATSAAF